MALTVPFNASADEQPAVSVSVIGRKDFANQVFTAKVRVQFNDPSLYNGQLFLSYHIYSDSEFHASTVDGIFENERYPLVLDENYCAEYEIPIDCSQTGFENSYVQFDIVDTANVFWYYLLDDSSKYSLDMIHSVDDPVKAWLDGYVDAIAARPFIFVVNVIVFAGVIVAIVVVRRKNIFSFKRKSN